jgi:PPOX class probable F420-dependent enzyme
VSVDVAAAQEFLRDNHHAVLSTSRADGRSQLSPVTAAVDDEGRVIISTREPAMKVRNLRRDPQVSLVAFTDRFYGDWVQVEGTAEIIALPEALDLLVDYYRRAAGEHPDWDEYRAAMVEQRRVIVRFAIARAGPNVSG